MVLLFAVAYHLSQYEPSSPLNKVLNVLGLSGETVWKERSFMELYTYLFC